MAKKATKAKKATRPAKAAGLDPVKLEKQYKDALLEDVIPFWEKHSLDRQCGGYFSCLDRKGNVFDTDKFMWLQGRQVWTFSKLYNNVERRPGWLEIAKLGVDFLKKHGRDDGGNFYFALRRDGEPMVAPYNIFSDSFACLGFSQYALASGDDEARQIALDTYHNILRRLDNPKGRWSKAQRGARAFQTLVMPMILSNLTLELDWALEASERDRVLEESVHQVMDLCVDKERLITFENVNPDGSHCDCLDGRVVSPGHGIEAMWFMMAVARRRNDRAMIQRCAEVALSLLDFGWDKKHGGIFYFRDATYGAPADRLDWDQKLWWVHLETLVSLLMGYNLTRRRQLWKAFQKVHDWTWEHFADPRYGEWFGYLRREGQPLLTIKGGKWKGCFHVPRGLYMVWRELQMLNGKND